MPQEEDKSRIDELNTSLYSRSAPDVRTRRKLRFTDSAGSNVKNDWEHPPAEDVRPESLNTEYKDTSMSFFSKLLIFSALFCVVAVGIGAYLFFNGSNLISANNIDIQISGPVSIPGGEPETFDISVVNKNNVDLQLADLSVDFPTGSTDPANPGTPLTTFQKTIGNIPAGGTAHQSVGATIFGEENLQKEITVTLTYSIKGSTSVFTKTQTYDVLINSSPINVTVSSFKEITSGQEFDLTVDMKSNSEQALRGVILKAQYPFGYTYMSSNLPTASDNATWKIGDIPPGGDRVVTIHGKLSGENTDTRVFHFSVGTQSPSDPTTIGTEYMSVEQDLTIQKPFVSLGITIDNDQGTADHIGQYGSNESVDVSWYNNLPVAVSNVVITATLSGSAYDKTAVIPQQGNFDSAAGTITWNQQTTKDLASVPAGGTGHVTFNITPKNLGTADNPIQNPTLVFNVSVRGNRAQEANVPSTIVSAASRTTRIASAVSLSGRIVRSVGPFANTGPIPPKAEQATTYTVIWDVDNASSAVGNAVVSAKLPPYVKWTGNTSPSGEQVSYDQNSGLVTWNVGNVAANTAGSSRRREAAFQISFTPNVTQVNQSPTLVGVSTLTAVDSYTQAQLQSTQDQMTTRFSTDPSYQNGYETVTQ